MTLLPEAIHDAPPQITSRYPAVRLLRGRYLQAVFARTHDAALHATT